MTLVGPMKCEYCLVRWVTAKLPVRVDGSRREDAARMVAWRGDVWWTACRCQRYSFMGDCVA